MGMIYGNVGNNQPITPHRILDAQGCTLYATLHIAINSFLFRKVLNVEQ